MVAHHLEKGERKNQWDILVVESWVQNPDSAGSNPAPAEWTGVYRYDDGGNMFSYMQGNVDELMDKAKELVNTGSTKDAALVYATLALSHQTRGVVEELSQVRELLSEIRIELSVISRQGG